MNDAKYTAKYFRDNHPAKKNKKSSWLVRNFYRKISFYVTAIANRLGLYANLVSFIGLILAFIAAGLLIVPNKVCNIVSVIACFLWMICDCVDGNLARLVAKQKYGEFIDACGSYTLVALLLPAAGFAAYQPGNSYLMSGNPWVILLGAISGLSDCMTRLYYQKYKNEKMILEGRIENVRTTSNENSKENKLYNIYMRLSKEIGLTGLLIPFLLISVILGWLDIFTIFYLLFYGFNFIVTFIMLIMMTGCLRK